SSSAPRWTRAAATPCGSPSSPPASTHRPRSRRPAVVEEAPAGR
ncbi:MAG: Cell division protein FtsZ, partial [uncultured Chloroflexi bacterium]